jgi:clan AA aspartic protease (TIGR02281 family)
MNIQARKLLVKAKLIGRKFSVSEDAVTDTGAAFTVIPPETADYLELELNKDYPKATLVTASGIIETPVKILNRIEVANIKVENLPVVIHKIPDPAPVKILLGMNFIESVKLIVDGKKGTFDLEDPQS